MFSSEIRPIEMYRFPRIKPSKAPKALQKIKFTKSFSEIIKPLSAVGDIDISSVKPCHIAGFEAVFSLHDDPRMPIKSSGTIDLVTIVVASPGAVEPNESVVIMREASPITSAIANVPVDRPSQIGNAWKNRVAEDEQGAVQV